MKQANITIDINKLSTDELEMIKKLIYQYGNGEDYKKVKTRISFLNGWMSEKQEHKYLEEIL